MHLEFFGIIKAEGRPGFHIKKGLVKAMNDKMPSNGNTGKWTHSKNALCIMGEHDECEIESALDVLSEYLKKNGMTADGYIRYSGLNCSGTYTFSHDDTYYLVCDTETGEEQFADDYVDFDFEEGEYRALSI